MEKCLIACLFLVCAGIAQNEPAANELRKTTVVRVTISGAEALTDEERRDLVVKLKGSSEREDWLAKLTERAKRWLADDGFANATVTLSTEDTSLQGGTREVVLHAAIKEGPRFRVAQVWWGGDSAFTLDELRDTILLKADDIFRPALVHRSEGFLHDKYVQHGYSKPQIVTLWQLFSNEPVVGLYFEIRAGKRNRAAGSTSANALATKPRGHRTECNEPKKTPTVLFPITRYDPKRDGLADLTAAKREATRSGRKILMIVGGEWCGWCHVLDEVFQNHPVLQAKRDKHYVALHVNFSEENRNECALERLPEPKAYPTVYVLDEEGVLLHNDSTTGWQYAGGYDPGRIEEFLENKATLRNPR